MTYGKGSGHNKMSKSTFPKILGPPLAGGSGAAN